MIRLDISELMRAAGIRRKAVTLRPIEPTGAQENEIYSIYLNSIRIWQRCAAQIAASWTQPTITVDADGRELQWLVDQANAQADATIIYQTDKLGKWVTKVGSWHGQKTIFGVKSATGTDIAPFIRLSDADAILREAVRRNTALISNVNADTKNRIEQVIYDGFARRLNKKQLTDELAKAMGITKRRARIIAGDQTHKLNIALTQYRNQQLGITSYKWMTRRDDRVRPAHRARQGKLFRWDKPPFDGHPGYAVGCRCIAQAVIDAEE